MSDPHPGTVRCVPRSDSDEPGGPLSMPGEGVMVPPCRGPHSPEPSNPGVLDAQPLQFGRQRPFGRVDGDGADLDPFGKGRADPPELDPSASIAAVACRERQVLSLKLKERRTICGRDPVRHGGATALAQLIIDLGPTPPLDEPAACSSQRLALSCQVADLSLSTREVGYTPGDGECEAPRRQLATLQEPKTPAQFARPSADGAGKGRGQSTGIHRAKWSAGLYTFTASASQRKNRKHEMYETD
jgi:hypothetical protein